MTFYGENDQTLDSRKEKRETSTDVEMSRSSESRMSQLYKKKMREGRRLKKIGSVEYVQAASFRYYKNRI